MINWKEAGGMSAITKREIPPEELTSVLLSFPEHGLFSEEVAQLIQVNLNIIQENHAKNLRELGNQAGIGWNVDGSPDTVGMSGVEHVLGIREKSILITLTAHALNKKLPKRGDAMRKAFFDNVPEMSLEAVPGSVYHFFKD